VLSESSSDIVPDDRCGCCCADVLASMLFPGTPSLLYTLLEESSVDEGLVISFHADSSYANS
jgi:hypothetical protein